MSSISYRPRPQSTSGERSYSMRSLYEAYQDVAEGRVREVTVRLPQGTATIVGGSNPEVPDFVIEPGDSESTSGDLNVSRQEEIESAEKTPIFLDEGKATEEHAFEDFEPFETEEGRNISEEYGLM